MKNVKDMSDQKIVQWLEKTYKSISQFKRNSPTIGSRRSYELIDRYTELRDEAIERGIWKKFCKQNNSDTSHDAYDLWA